jgi:hypothetical protein
VLDQRQHAGRDGNAVEDLALVDQIPDTLIRAIDGSIEIAVMIGLARSHFGSSLVQYAFTQRHHFFGAQCITQTRQPVLIEMSFGDFEVSGDRGQAQNRAHGRRLAVGDGNSCRHKG